MKIAASRKRSMGAWRWPFWSVLAAVSLVLAAPPVAVAEPAAEPENAIVHVHDPDAIKEGRWYYVFSTGPGVMIRRSRDLKHWTNSGRVFPKEIPA